jgi:hypothetical protein
MKTQLSLGGAALVSLIVFLYKIIPPVRTLQAWTGWNQPAMAADILDALMYALVALALGIGIPLVPIIQRTLRGLLTTADENSRG